MFDLGCGYGRTLNYLKEKGFKNLYGSDISIPMLKHSRETGAEVIQSEGRNIPFKNNVFDFVFLIAVLTCVTNSDEQKLMASEIYRILKPGGILFIADFLLNDDERNKRRYKKYYNSSDSYGVFEIDDGAKLRHHDESYLRRLFSDFETKRYHKTVFNTMNGNRSNGVYLILKKK